MEHKNTVRETAYNSLLYDPAEVRFAHFGSKF